LTIQFVSIKIKSLLLLVAGPRSKEALMKRKQAEALLVDSERSDEAALVQDALSHPVRVRILGWMRHQPARTQSEVGKALGISNAAARYHLKVLEGVGLVNFQGTRPGPNSITEKLYAYNPEVWKRVSADANRAEKLDFMLDYTFASIQEIHRKAVDIIKSEWGSPFIAGSVGAFATPAEIERLKGKLESLTERFYRDHKDPKKHGAVPVAITFAVLPSSDKDAQGWAGERVFEWHGKDDKG
jgi:DNA-binding transcriptional ArsR family regulator